MSNYTGDHPLADFGVVYERAVDWGHMDALGHVNNVTYYWYAQCARSYYLRQAKFPENNYSVIAHSSCKYISPVVYPDTLKIGVRAKKIGNTSLVNEYVLFSEKQQKVVAIMETVLVFFDDKGENKRSLTEEERQNIMNADKKIA